MKNRFARRADSIKPSAIREISKLLTQPDAISFAGGWPSPELFPVEELKQICTRVLDESGSDALQYGPSEGYLPLREFIAGRMSASGAPMEAQNIIITSGSQQGLEFSGKLFIDEGDVIICESPSYAGALSAFRSYLPRFREVRMDGDGMRMDDLERALKENPDTKFIYTIPDFQNPTGITMSLEKRKRLIELAEEYDTYIIEDSPYRELRFEDVSLPPVKSLDTKGLVIYLGTFSKTFCPGLRIGWAAASTDIVRKFELLKQSADTHNNSMAQRELYSFVKMFDYEAHIGRIIAAYRHKRDVMLQTMEREFPPGIGYTVPKGGLFVWVTLPGGMDAQQVLVKALEQKVAFVPGSAFFPNRGNANHFRLNYATMPAEQIIDGITRLGKVLKSL